MPETTPPSAQAEAVADAERAELNAILDAASREHLRSLIWHRERVIADLRAALVEARQVKQHRESLLRHCAQIEREFVPSTRWRAVPILERAEAAGILAPVPDGGES